MRVGRRWVVAVVAVVAAVVPACGDDDSAALARAHLRETVGEELAIAGVPEDGRLAGNVATLELSGADVEIVEPDGDTSGRTGHYVLFVDREPVELGAKIPEDRDVIETTEAEVKVPGFTTGSHTVFLVLADGAHRRIGTKAAEATFTVSGPTLRATAGVKSPPGEPVVVTVAVQGVTAMAPDGSTGTDTGHFDLLVDREPPAALDKPVPTERGVVHAGSGRVQVEGLGNGEHEVWVVLVRGDHTPFDPLVADRVAFEVG